MFSLRIIAVFILVFLNVSLSGCKGSGGIGIGASNDGGGGGGGSLTPFGVDGRVVTNFGFPSTSNSSNDRIRSLKVLSDGKILVSAESSWGLTLARYDETGVLDTTFNFVGMRFTDSSSGNSYGFAESVEVQSDGKIFVGGYRYIGGSNDFSLNRFLSNGALDTTFNSTGRVAIDIGATSEDFARAMQIQADGKILLAGYSDSAGSYDFAVVRFNADGSLDTSFNSTGKVLTDIGTASHDRIYSLQLQSDGKIVVAGYSDSGGSDDFAVVRYNADGSLDTSFNSTGKVLTDIGTASNDRISSLKIQSDGKIVVAGYSEVGGAEDFAVVRYNADGSLDTSFNSTGKVVTDVDTASVDNLTSLQVQSDGKIVVAGYSEIGPSTDFAIVRYNADGSLDTMFNTTGKVTLDVGTNSWDYIRGMEILTSGKILVVGSSDANGSDDFTLVRYNSNGSLDTGFSSTGKVLTDVPSMLDTEFGGIQIQTDGKVVVAGSVDLGNGSDFFLVRYEADGSLDTTFNTNGKVFTDIGSGSSDIASGLQIQTDGKIVVVGYSDANGSNDFTVARYNADGSLDTSFNSVGVVTTDIGTTSIDYALDVAIQSDGKIVVAGYSDAGGSDDFTVVRYNADGSLDTSFNSTGKVQTDIGTASNDSLSDIRLQSDGKIVASGYTNANGSSDITLVRYNVDGSLDTSFNSTGVVTSDIGSGSDDGASGLLIQADGKIVVGGWSNANGDYDFALVRYDANGALDTSFNTTGKVITNFGSGSDDSLQGIQIQTDGKIVASGFAHISDNDIALVRYNADGSLDTSFNSTGVLVTEIGTDSQDVIRGIQLLDTGEIFVAGDFSSGAGGSICVMRFNSDGSF